MRGNLIASALFSEPPSAAEDVPFNNIEEKDFLCVCVSPFGLSPVIATLFDRLCCYFFGHIFPLQQKANSNLEKKGKRKRFH